VVRTLSSLDNHGGQIILLFRSARKRKNRSIKSRDDVTRVLFLRLTNGVFESFGPELFAFSVGPFEETVRGQD
jgi:hypothetical protein